MPTYEYQCQACNHQLEAFQSIKDAPLTQCPHCEKASLVKLISATGFQLKGSGWYVTDFKNSSNKQPADKSADSASPSNNNAKSETKKIDKE